MLPGIDVSNNNGHVDWGAVAGAGIAFGIAKVTEGTGFVDRFFAGNWAGMKASGMVRGAYHFGRPSVNGAVAEANFFLDTIQNRVGDLEAGDIVALDLEDPDAGGDLSAWTLEFLTHVKNRVGFNPLLYSGPFFLQEHGCTNQPALADFGLWLASYRDNLPPAPSPWGFIAIWQNTDSASIPGVAGNCDGDFFNGTRDRLVLYGKPA